MHSRLPLCLYKYMYVVVLSAMKYLYFVMYIVHILSQISGLITCAYVIIVFTAVFVTA